MRMIHIGKQVPKELAKLGWKEVSGMHLGRGVWVLSLEKAEPEASEPSLRLQAMGLGTSLSPPQPKPKSGTPKASLKAKIKTINSLAQDIKALAVARKLSRSSLALGLALATLRRHQ